MEAEILYTIIFGSIASILAIAAMIQNFIQRRHKSESRHITDDYLLCFASVQFAHYSYLLSC